MPTLWYHTGPLAGKIRAVDAATARRDIEAGIAQDMQRPGGPLKRATYNTRDMQAAEPQAMPKARSLKKKGGAEQADTDATAPAPAEPATPEQAPAPVPAPSPAAEPPAEVGTPDTGEPAKGA